MQEFVQTLNKKKIPFDVLLPSGQVLRRLFGLAMDGPDNAEDAVKLEGDLIMLVPKAYRHECSSKREKNATFAPNHIVAPCAIHIRNGVCRDLKNRIVAYQNKLRYVGDISDGGDAFLRIPILQKGVFEVFPTVAMGATKAVIGTNAGPLEEAIIQFGRELENLLVNLNNTGLAAVNGKSAPRPAIGIDGTHFYRYMKKMKVSKTYPHKFSYPR